MIAEVQGVPRRDRQKYVNQKYKETLNSSGRTDANFLYLMLMGVELLSDPTINDNSVHIGRDVKNSAITPSLVGHKGAINTAVSLDAQSGLESAELVQILAEIRDQLNDSPLDADVREVVSAQVDLLERELQGASPKPTVLKMILKGLSEFSEYLPSLAKLAAGAFVS